MTRRAIADLRTDRGLTVIELVVVLALIGILMVVAVPTMRAVFGADLREATLELAQTIRYVRAEAVLRNTPMRIAYDLDGSAWWVEAADGAVRIFRNRDEREAFAEFLTEKAEADERVREDADRRRSAGPTQSDLMAQLLGDQAGGDEAGGMGGMGGLLGGLFGGGGGFAPGVRGGEYNPNQFGPILGDVEGDEHLVRRELGAVRFAGVWTPQYDQPVEPLDEYELEAMMRELPEDQKWTVVYTHVFPGAYTEDSVIYLSDETGDDIYSIRVEPLTGLVEVEKGRIDLPDLSDRELRQ